MLDKGNDMNTEIPFSRILVVSNRLPFEVKEDDEGGIAVTPGSGGLVTALAPVLKSKGGVWIGWPGGSKLPEDKLSDAILQAGSSAGFAFEPVFLSEAQVDQYYNGFSNEILWPLFHDLQVLCHFVPAYWESYQEVNRLFASSVKDKALPDDFIWVHDYQLMLVGKELRQQGVTSKVGYFLHIPFPAPDEFMKLPWRVELLDALLEYDLVGFQTLRDKNNFVQCLRLLRKDIKIKHKAPFHLCFLGDRKIRIGAFPISIDFQEFSDAASDKEVEEKAWLLHEKFGDQKLVLGVDRLDYTKGIPYRLEAIRRFLKDHPEFHQKVCFLQMIVPSREFIPKYQEFKELVDKLVGEINSQFTKEGWVPIHHQYRALPRVELLAHYRTCEALLVTPVKDGMNLVCKEYIASNIDETGVLLLSEFAGAAAQLNVGSVLIHPYDIVGMANAIHQALVMPEEERRDRMKRMRRLVRRQDVWRWTSLFFNAVDTPVSPVPIALSENA